MSANYLHGVETVLVKRGPRPVNIVKAAVIGLIGLAPIDPDDENEFDATRTSATLDRNKPFLVLNADDAAAFGPEIPGFTIPQALDAIQDQGAATVVVVNVYDPTKHNATVSAETVTLSSEFRSKTAHPPVEDFVLSKSGFDYTKGTHYALDAFGNIVMEAPAINGVAPIGSFDITAGSAGAGNQVTQVTIDSVTLLTAAVLWVTSHAATAAAVAAAITSGPSNYTATSDGAKVIITGTPAQGDSVNGEAITVAVGGNVTVGNLAAMAGGVPQCGSTVTANYKRLDASLVTNADIIGAVSGNTRTGLEVFDMTKPLMGFKPRILIAPGFSQIPAIKTELISKANKYFGFALIDSPAGWTRAQAIADRGPSGTVFNSSAYSAIGLYPRAKRYDAATDADVVYPYSPFFAGAWTATINEKGFWYSPSNRELQGLVGIETTITADISDAQTDANLLNEKGIVTFYADGGFFTWGNRSLAFPTFSDVENFMSIRMTVAVIKDSIEAASRQFLDQPLDDALIDQITETVNDFIRRLKSRGALIDGECFFDPDKNPTSQLANGQLVLGIRFMPPPPMERLTFETYLDVNILSQLGGNQ
jgi:phage tail sheath protein FI